MNLLFPYYLLLEYLLIIRIKLDEKIHNQMPRRWENKASKTILLLQGVHSKAHGLKKIGNALNKKGYRILTINELGNNTLTVSEGSNLLEKFIKSNNLSDLTIIAHSKGGLIAKHFIDNSKEKRKVKKIISISTPYRGSLLAYLIGDRDMFPKSEIIHNFNNDNNLIITQLYPTFDNHVFPHKSLILKGGNNIEIPIIGHTRILWSSKTTEHIIKLL